MPSIRESRFPRATGARTAPLLAALALCAVAGPRAARADEEAKKADWERKEFDCERPKEGTKSCDEPGCCDFGFGVWTRRKGDSPIREVKAVGEVDAPPERVFAVFSDYEHQAGRLPYVQEQKVFARTDDEVLFWTIADFPLVSRRDWVMSSTLERNVEGGKWRASWHVIDLAMAPPPQEGVVRLKTSDGSWTAEPIDGGKRSRATYYLYTDPGGSIPAFIANKANTSALPKLFAAIRKLSAAK
jgi:hypothetical protein